MISFRYLARASVGRKISDVGDMVTPGCRRERRTNSVFQPILLGLDFLVVRYCANYTPLLLTISSSSMLGFKMTTRPFAWVSSRPPAFPCYGPTAKVLGRVNITAREMGVSAASGDPGCLVVLIKPSARFSFAHTLLMFMPTCRLMM